MPHEQYVGQPNPVLAALMQQLQGPYRAPVPTMSAQPMQRETMVAEEPSVIDRLRHLVSGLSLPDATSSGMNTSIDAVRQTLRDLFAGVGQGGDRVSSKSLSDLVTEGAQPPAQEPMPPRTGLPPQGGGDIELPAGRSKRSAPAPGAGGTGRAGARVPSPLPSEEINPLVSMMGIDENPLPELPVNPDQVPLLMQARTPEAQQFGRIQPKQPSLLGEIGRNLLIGINQNITPALIALAASRSNSPEFVTAWAEQNSKVLRELDLRMEHEATQARLMMDVLAAQRAEDQLMLNRLTGQKDLMGQVQKAQLDMAPKDPLAYMKFINGLRPMAAAYKMDPDLFNDSTKLPNAILLDTLKKNFLDAYRVNAGNMETRSVINPWAPVDPKSGLPDPRQNFTLQEAATLLGQTTPDGRILEPLGELRPSDIVVRETRNAAGQTKTFRSKIGEALGATDIKETEPQFQTQVIPHPTIPGKNALIITDLKSGAMKVVETPGAVEGFQALPGISREITGGQRREQMIAYMTQRLGREPNTADLDRAVTDPTWRAGLDAYIAQQKSKQAK